MSNRVAYAQACERSLGLAPDASTRRARTILLELERLWSHLNDIAAICAGVGMAAGNHRFAALSEDARRLNERLAGHRLLFDTVDLGGSGLVLDAAAIGDARATIEAIDTAARRGLRDLAFNASFQDRLPDVGVLTTETAIRHGAVGPAARAAGVNDDVRTHSPLLDYDGFVTALPESTIGDVKARYDQRERELHQTTALLGRLLDHPLAPGSCTPSGSPKRLAVAQVESPRGRTICVIERDRDTLRRLRLRTGSYANWPVLAHIAPGNLLPDFPLINKSFELCYACADR